MGKRPPEIEGYLVAGSTGILRLVVGNHMLEFSREDVLEVTNLVVPEGIEIKKSIPVRVKLTPKARLLNACPIDPLKHVFSVGALPFSLAVRSEVVQVFESPKFKALEKAFLKEHGLESD